MLDALKGQLCSKLCRHNIHTPTPLSSLTSSSLRGKEGSEGGGEGEKGRQKQRGEGEGMEEGGLQAKPVSTWSACRRDCPRGILQPRSVCPCPCLCQAVHRQNLSVLRYVHRTTEGLITSARLSSRREMDQ